MEREPEPRGYPITNVVVPERGRQRRVLSAATGAANALDTVAAVVCGSAQCDRRLDARQRLHVGRVLYADEAPGTLHQHAGQFARLAGKLTPEDSYI